MAVKNLVPELPSGVRIGEKPSDLEICCIRNADRWKCIIDTLKVMESTKTIQIDITPELTKSKIQSMRSSLKLYASKTGFKPKIKFAVKDNTLHIWCNK